MTRGTYARAVLGPELYARLADTKVLLVGAGGIGCELLKNIVLTGFGHITLLDLDTIDLSNLNRQFLFRKKDVKQSKALVAAQTAGAFNPAVKITPLHANIKDPQFDIEWFMGFDIVLNALDNLDARRHVNKMCMAAGVPLVESGTAGYLGQVQPMLKDRTECFDCIPKETPKTFPVCTIRSTPSQPIHCIVWAKNYLMPQFFGEDEEAANGMELDEAEKQGENAQEIATLRKEAQAFKAVRDALRAPGEGQTAAKAAFQKVFHADILNLLSMGDMWKTRAPPTPLDFDGILEGRFMLKTAATATILNANGQASAKPTNGAGAALPTASGSKIDEGKLNNESAVRLKDQKTLSLLDNLVLFIDSTKRLSERLRTGEETIAFDKDDTDALDFVTAAANLRAAAYGIGGKTRWEIKEMAGNIIPAIATTNAIVAGLIVLQALQLLRKAYTAMRNVNLKYTGNIPLSASTTIPPNAACGVCRDTYALLRCDPARVTLGEVVRGVLGEGGEDGGTGEREVSVYEDKRVLSDPDWDDNNGRTLESLNVTRGKFLTIVDEEGEWGTIALGLGVLPPYYPIDAPAMILPSPLPTPPRRAKPVLPSSPSTPPPNLKRPAPDDDDIVEANPTKRTKHNGPVPQINMASPSKKRRLEEDGLIMMESAEDRLEDDVIELD